MASFHQKISVRLTLSLMPVVGLSMLVLGAFGAWRESRVMEREMKRDAEVLADVIAQLASDARASPDETRAWVEKLDEQIPDTTLHFLPAHPGVANDGPPPPRPMKHAMVVATARIGTGERSAGWIRVEEPLSSRDDYLLRAILVESLGVGVAILVATLAARVVGGTLISTRVHAIRDYLRAVGRGELPTAPPALGQDEIGEIGAAAQGMSHELRQAREAAAEAERERAKASLITRRAERLAAVGKMSAAFAHEVGTPLAVILGRARKLERQGDADTRRAATIVTEQAERISTFVQRMLAYARHDDRFELVPVDLAQVVDTAVHLIAGRARARNVQVQTRVHAAQVLGDQRALEQVCVNLLTNAIDASPSGGVVDVDVQVIDAGHPRGTGHPTAHVQVDVSDQGPGIPVDARARVFDPFFTTKSPEHGTGLGLYIVQDIVRDLGGSIIILDTTSGCAMRVQLPLVETDRGR